MLKLGEMDHSRVDRLGALAAQAVEQALASGLAWDEAIVAFGIAARAIAAKAASVGDRPEAEYLAHAEARLTYGMDQGADVLRAYLS